MPEEAWMRDLIVENNTPFLNSILPTIIPNFRDWASSLPQGSTIHTLKEYPTGAGPCDILFALHGYLVVVELKRTTIEEAAVAQILRYMGALYAHTGIEPHGILCAPQISRQAEYALRATQRVYFKRFCYSYFIEEPEITEPPAESPDRITLTEIIAPHLHEESVPGGGRS